MMTVSFVKGAVSGGDDDFLADKSPNAYEKAVDRLLANQHFGERMTVATLVAHHQHFVRRISLHHCHADHRAGLGQVDIP